ncbi:MAG: hypothetical protein JOZ74_13050 [Bradyrhizobium sp.]|nr:hypothetical protein [Bradyrhizobium sp.]
MRSKTLLFAAIGSLWLTSAAAQTSLGGANKQQIQVGGPATHPNPVVSTRSASGGKLTNENRQKK